MTGPRSTRRFRMTTRGWLFAVAAILAGCGVPTDDAPRDITGAARRDLLVDANVAGATSGSSRIYLVLPGQAGAPGQLRAVTRDVDETPTDLLTALLGGPNAGEQAAQLSTALPAGTKLRGVRLGGGVADVDLSGALDQLTGETLIDAVAQVVLTMTEIPTVRSVRLLVEGQATEWPDGSGELRSDPLTRFDFPGLVESSQPDYPATAGPSA